MERWYIALEIKKFIRKNFRLLTYVLLVTFVTIYLFFSTSGSNQKGISEPNNIGNEELVAESNVTEGTEETTESSEEAAVEVPIYDSEADQITLENRPSNITGNPTEIEGHLIVAENTDYQLFLKESNLSIIVREKETGAVMYSTVENPVKSNEKWSNFVSSGVVVEYLVGTNIVYSQADMNSPKVSKKITSQVDGFDAAISFDDLGISFDLRVKINEQGLQVEVPESSIKELDPQYKIGNMYLYPFLGYSKIDEEAGYMLIPDGSGALIALEDHHGQFNQPYSEPVYGTNYGIDDPYVLSLKNNQVTTSQPNMVTAPIFGMIHEDKKFGFIGIIQEGDYNARIEAYPNGAILPYNWITSKFTYRQFFNQSTSKNSGTMVVQQKERNQFDAKIQYNFVKGEEADYVGLAKSYRNYLLENQIITKNTEEQNFKIKLDFLGAEVKQGMVSDKTIAMTTFEDVDLILEKLAKNNVTNIDVVLKGWQEKGIYGGYAQNQFNAETALGGNDSLNYLLKKYESKIPIYLYDDALRFNPATQNSTWFDVVTKLNKRTLTEEVYGSHFSNFNFLQPKESKDLLLKRLNSQLVNGYEGISLDGITNHLFAYYAKGTEYGRNATLDDYTTLMSQVMEHQKMMLHTPIQPFWKYATSFVDTPIASSNYIFEHEAVPFFSIALRGIVTRYSEYGNFTANKSDFKLQLIEQGINPAFLITMKNPSELKNTNSSTIYSSQFDDYKEEIIDLYEELSQVHEAIGDSLIEDYSKNKNQVMVSFTNGKKILLNYGETTEIVDAVEIPPHSYKVVQE